jgi:hypothetical protein
MISTTTAIDLDEELLNRCLVLTVDETREQTRAIHEQQRRRQTLEGQLERRKRERVRTLHQNAQRLLRPLVIANPFAQQLRYPDSCTRTRRDHEKYLALIGVIALLHQHQREVRTVAQGDEEVSYVEVSASDIEWANRLAHEVLGRSLDELPPQTRHLLLAIEDLVAKECEALGVERSEYRFSRRFLRERLGHGDTQLKVHLGRLVELEYLVAHRQWHAQRHLYELLYDGAGKGGEQFLPGLIDPHSIAEKVVDANRSGQDENRSGSGRPLVGGWSGGGRSGVEPMTARDSGENGTIRAKNALIGESARVVAEAGRNRVARGA